MRFVDSWLDQKVRGCEVRAFEKGRVVSLCECARRDYLQTLKSALRSECSSSCPLENIVSTFFTVKYEFTKASFTP